jgi:MarR family transcriptional regulator, organic hydroperoxide resistance regulator
VTRNSWFIETEVFLLHEVVARLDRLARRRVLDENGLTYAEFLLAMAVNELERPTQADVGELLDMSKSLVSQRVGDLLAKRFIVQQRDAENRRQVRLDLTPAGRRTLEQVYQRLADSAESLFKVLGPSRPQFLQSLRRLRDAVADVEASLEGGKPPTLR